MQWVYGAPDDLQDKIDTVEKMHEFAVELNEDLVTAMKDEDKPAIRKAKADIKDHMLEIDLFMFPDDERQYVESKESRRFRLEQQNELTLDAASIAALRGGSVESGSTSDASVAHAKRDLALEKIKELEGAAAPKRAAKKAARKAAPVPSPASYSLEKESNIEQ